MLDDRLTQALVELQQARLSLTRRALALEQRPVGGLRLWSNVLLGAALVRLNRKIRRAEVLLKDGPGGSVQDDSNGVASAPIQADAADTLQRTEVGPDYSARGSEELTSWVRAQMAPWTHLAPLDPEMFAVRVREAEAVTPSVFLYDLAYDHVSIRPKTSPAHPADRELLRRAQLYCDFLQVCLSRFGARLRYTIAIDVDDHPVLLPGVPLFAFQKHDQTSTLILLPDVDLLANSFFIDQGYQDNVAFEEKLDRAIFVGATTGANLTEDIITAGSLPRLRAAVFFKSDEDVRFSLPKIVQCDGPATVRMVEELGIGGPEVAWSEQLGYRYLLSMDGNGATCSRVAIALHSQSALVKYDSEFRLHYFDGLKPGREFLPVGQDGQVLDIIHREREGTGVAQAAALAGRAFAQRYLSRPSTAAYVIRLLELYGEVVGAPAVRAADELALLVDVFGHVQDRGDVWAGADGWLGAPSVGAQLEGFGLDTGADLDGDGVRYQAVLADGALSPVAHARGFCGTRGEKQPLQGLRVWLEGRAAERYELGCEAIFNDGRQIGPVWDGGLVQSAPGSVLTALRVTVRRRQTGEAI